MNALAQWAQCNIEAEVALADVDVSTLMWLVRRKIDLAELLRRRAVIRYPFPRHPPPKHPHYCLVVEPGANVPKLCSADPHRDVDLYVETCVVSLGAILEAAQASCERRKGAAFF
ncbi:MULTISPECIES: hypothetical protein [unclassified Mesorhizobium]|uniref:hypothetical protein n=1 Tax=unclassified Mesorhizobium TaxID=325217 RepID=UPI000FD853EE|nr:MULTISPECIES: hypothetical protein [unclassified Mesorhizobium]TGQ09081.1 hypothetical protein EN862_022935 [Mesorhizobium sp. M2E.F.Ca.ET.219.01.1.1]TGT69616.1 hypothetical protein EN809_025215 [Mesorhizobium sp. M2E.F.Ca.ET.166.01.1.1]TGW01947.1 hypothetical protein EN797_016705 [Mesorhizobium sp. M2E.F.Ca.ET.154.01.1.1]